MNKIYNYIVLALFGAIIALFLVRFFENKRYEKEILGLQNKVAASATTVQVTQDLFQKQAIETKNISDLLDQKNAQNAELLNQINKQKGTVLSLTTVTLKPKEANGDIKLSASEPSSQSSSQASSQPQVCFDTDEYFEFNTRVGRYVASGDVYLGNHQLKLKIDQDPIELSVAMVQNKDGKWNSLVQTDDPNLQTDIKVSSVDPWVLESHWYEKIGVGAQLGIGQSGLLVGAGLNYALGIVTVGPNVWLTTGDKVNAFYGASVNITPFANPNH